MRNPNDRENYTDGSAAAGRVSLAEQFKGEGPDQTGEKPTRYLVGTGDSLRLGKANQKQCWFKLDVLTHGLNRTE